MHPKVHCGAIYSSRDMEAAKCAPVEGWVQKMWYVCTMEYYSAIKVQIMPLYIVLKVVNRHFWILIFNTENTLTMLLQTLHRSGLMAGIYVAYTIFLPNVHLWTKYTVLFGRLALGWIVRGVGSAEQVYFRSLCPYLRNILYQRPEAILKAAAGIFWKYSLSWGHFHSVT